MNKIATISLNKNTKNHNAVLSGAGFRTRVVDNALQILCSGYVEQIALPQGREEETLRALAAKGMLLTYQTKVWFVDAEARYYRPDVHKAGKPLVGVPACLKLGALSAFVVSPLGDFDPATGAITVTRKEKKTKKG